LNDIVVIILKTVRSSHDVFTTDKTHFFSSFLKTHIHTKHLMVCFHFEKV